MLNTGTRARAHTHTHTQVLNKTSPEPLNNRLISSQPASHVGRLGQRVPHSRLRHNCVREEQMEEAPPDTGRFLFLFHSRIIVLCVIHGGAFDKNRQLIWGNKVKCRFILAVDSNAVKDVKWNLIEFVGECFWRRWCEWASGVKTRSRSLHLYPVYSCVRHIMLDANVFSSVSRLFICFHCISSLSPVLPSLSQDYSKLLFYSRRRHVLLCFRNAKRCLFLNTGVSTHVTCRRSPASLHSFLFKLWSEEEDMLSRMYCICWIYWVKVYLPESLKTDVMASWAQLNLNSLGHSHL